MPSQPSTRTSGHRCHSFPAPLAEAGIGVVACKAAAWAGDLLPGAQASQFYGNDARWHSNNGIPHQHHQRRQQLAQDSLGRDVAVPHRSNRHDGPVDATRNAGEAVVSALHEIDHRADNGDQNKHRGHEDRDFVHAGLERREDHVCAGHVLGQLEDTKDPQDSQQPNDQ
jgi:hypothetical protein